MVNKRVWQGLTLLLTVALLVVGIWSGIQAAVNARVSVYTDAATCLPEMVYPISGGGSHTWTLTGQSRWYDFGLAKYRQQCDYSFSWVYPAGGSGRNTPPSMNTAQELRTAPVPIDGCMEPIIIVVPTYKWHWSLDTETITPIGGSYTLTCLYNGKGKEIPLPPTPTVTP